MEVIEKAHRLDTHKGNLGEWARIDVDLAASLRTVVGTHSARGPMGQPKQVRERLQQPCVVDARQHTIASGSCCCSSLGDSRSCPGFRTENSGGTVHSLADRHDSEVVRFALGRVFCNPRSGRLRTQRKKCWNQHFRCRLRKS
jgi:hypothetical protein